MIFLNSGAKTSNEVRFLPAATPGAAPVVVAPRETGHEYDVDHYNGELYITTNRAPRTSGSSGRRSPTPPSRTGSRSSNTSPAVRIGGLTFFANHLVVSEREGGLSYLRVDRHEDQASHRIATEEPDYALSLGRQSRVRDDDGAIQLPVDGDAVVGLRLRPRYEAADAAQADRSARRLRPGQLRVEAHLGGGARRHEGADLDRLSQGHEDRWHGAAAAVCLRILRRVAVADVLLEPPEPARSRRDLRAGLHPRRRRARRGLARAGPDEAEDEHLHRFHRLRRASRSRTSTRRPTAW